MTKNNFKLNERIKLEISIVDVLDREDNIVYVFNDTKSNVFLFETLKKYKYEYDDKFRTTNKISAIVEFINEFNQKIVISSLRFLKNDAII